MQLIVTFVASKKKANAIDLTIFSYLFSPKREETNSGTAQYKNDSPSTAGVIISNKDNAADLACNDNDDEDGVHDYHEVCVSTGVSNNHYTENENAEYHYVFDVSENHEPPYKIARRRSISESDYDTTSNVKVVIESSNIYSNFGYETVEGIYDSTVSKPHKNSVIDTNTDTYSTACPRENLYDTAATAETRISSRDSSIRPDDSIYSHAGTERKY